MVFSTLTNKTLQHLICCNDKNDSAQTNCEIAALESLKIQ